MNIVSARYMYADDDTTKTHIELYFGLDEEGGWQYEAIKIDNKNSRYIQIMEKVNNGELTIAEA